MADTRILLLTGKGGVGKTTVAAATALRSAALGRKTLLLSTDAAHSLADALDVRLQGEPSEIAPNLWAVQLDAQRRFEAAWADVQRYLVELVTRGGVDPITAEELTILPGIEEVLSLLAVRELASRGSWDVLVLDCAPTAETLRLLALPEALGWYLQKVLPLQRRLARGMRPLASILGRAEALPPDDLFDALLRLNDELAAVRQMLADPGATSVRLVLTPEAVVVAEATRTLTALALYGYNVDMVIANRIFPAGDDEFRLGWIAAQANQLKKVAESFVGLPLATVTYRGGEPVGMAALNDIAQEIYADSGVDRVIGPSDGAESSLMRVESDGAEYVLHLRLPLVVQASVEAARVGDDLVLTVAGNRRVLSLPSVLRRCNVVGGEVADGELCVRFAPNPDVWPRQAHDAEAVEAAHESTS